jgi:protein TonB
VDTDGTVKEAVVYVSSGVAVLDRAALKAAYKNKFRPAVQNGNPVAIWVTYKVKFELDS